MVNRLPTARPKPGPEARPDLVRSGRVALRCHPDLERILELRSREAGVSKSKYVEKLLVGWLGADPRNPRIDSIGKFVPGAQDPYDQRTAEPLKIAEKWQRFAQAHDLLLGHQPPRQWFEEADRFWPAPFGGHVDPVQQEEMAEPEERAAGKPKRR